MPPSQGAPPAHRPPLSPATAAAAPRLTRAHRSYAHRLSQALTAKVTKAVVDALGRGVGSEMWAIAYEEGDGQQRLHDDKGKTIIRVLFNITSSGKSRSVKVKNMNGGRVSATYIDGEGKEHRLESKAGQSELIIKIPSNGFYLMDAWGAGAHPGDLKWHHQPLPGDSDAFVLVVDVHVKGVNQKLAIDHLRKLLTTKPRRVGTRKVNVSSFIDLKTKTPDSLQRKKKRMGTPLPPHRRAVERRAPPMRAARRPLQTLTPPPPIIRQDGRREAEEGQPGRLAVPRRVHDRRVQVPRQVRPSHQSMQTKQPAVKDVPHFHASGGAQGWRAVGDHGPARAHLPQAREAADQARPPQDGVERQGALGEGDRGVGDRPRVCSRRPAPAKVGGFRRCDIPV